MIRALIFALLLASTPAFGDGLKLPSDWSRGDTYRQVSFTGLVVIDWAQTRWSVIDRPEQYHEGNPILGKHPSAGRLAAYEVAVIVGHAAISYMLPAKYRAYWQYGWIGIETGVVLRSYHMGIKMEF
jgi:hypothetical protein